MNSGIYLTNSDIQLGEITDNSLSLIVMNRKYELKGEEISTIFKDILPKLDGKATIDEALDDEKKKILLANLQLLEKIGALFKLSTRVSSLIESDYDREMYTYFYKTTASANDAFIEWKSFRIVIYSQVQSVERLWSNFLEREFKLNNIEIKNDMSDFTNIDENTFIIPIITNREVNKLDSIQLYCWNNNIKSCPIILGNRYIWIGPWMYPGYTGCLKCTEGFHPYNESDEDLLEKNCTLSPITTIWSTISFKHLVQKTIVGIGSSTPWGKVYKLDCNKTEITNSLLWKNPLCSLCSKESSKKVQSWMEV